MEHTEYYQLSLWEQDDRIQMENFNTDNQKIDAALAEKAAAATVTAQISALQGAMPKIATGSWTGNGANNRTIALPCTPKLVLVLGHYKIYTSVYPLFAVLAPDDNRYITAYGDTPVVSQSSDISFSGDSIYLSSPNICNTQGETVHYIAFC